MSFRLLIPLLSDGEPGPWSTARGLSLFQQQWGVPAQQKGWVGALFFPVETAAFLFVSGLLCLISVELWYGLYTWFSPGSSDTPAAHTGCS